MLTLRIILKRRGDKYANVQCIPNPTKWAMHHLIPLKIYAEGRVLLLGDAVRFSDVCGIS